MSATNFKPGPKVGTAKTVLKVSPFNMPLTLKKNTVSFIASLAKKSATPKLDQRGIVVETLSDALVLYFLHHNIDTCGAYLGNLHKCVVDDPKLCPSIVGACERINEEGAPMTIHAESTYPWYVFVHCLPESWASNPNYVIEWVNEVCAAFNAHSEKMHSEYKVGISQHEGKQAFVKLLRKFIIIMILLPRKNVFCFM